MKVGEVGLLLRRLYGYNSVCFLKPVTDSFKVIRMLEHGED